MTNVWGLSALILLAMGAVRWGVTAPTAPAALADGEVVVKMLGDGGRFRFDAETTTVKAGTTVRWVNESEARHTSTTDPKFAKKKESTELPAGVEPWASAFLTNGKDFSVKLDVPGTYRYFCRNHEQFGMVGTIVVEK